MFFVSILGLLGYYLKKDVNKMAKIIISKYVLLFRGCDENPLLVFLLGLMQIHPPYMVTKSDQRTIIYHHECHATPN